MSLFRTRQTLEGFSSSGDQIQTFRVVGEILFSANTTAYAVITHEQTPEHVFEKVVKTMWGLQIPDLVLSITGGAGHLSCDAAGFDVE